MLINNYDKSILVTVSNIAILPLKVKMVAVHY